MSKEHTYAKNLQAAQKGHRLKNIKKTAQEFAGEISLFKFIKLEDFIFVGFAISIALFKDVLDFVLVGSLPAIGTAVTLFASSAIAGSMYIAGANKGMFNQAKTSSFMLRRVLTWLGATLGEMIFGIDFLPIETVLVLALYRLILLERKEEAIAKQQEKALQESYAFA
jgi:hypothetical protein